MRKIKKQLFNFLMTLCLLMTLLPATAFAAEGDVAQIGDTTYATLDEAVAAAAEGDTIILLSDATTNGLNLSKTLTIQGADNLEKKPTITFNQYGIALWGKALTFKDCNITMNGIGSTPYAAEWSWMSVCASIDASLTLDNATMIMDAAGTTNSPHAIYFCQNNVLNVINDSVLTIKNYANDALEWDGGNGGYNVNITDSTFISDHNRSGFTGTFYATITNSDVDVINSRGNGSNGSHFIIDKSNLNFSNNGSHGLSAGNLEIKNESTVTAKNNGMYGVTYSGTMNMDGTSVMNVEGNASKSGGGLRAAYPTTTSNVASGAKMTISSNLHNGLENYGTFTFQDGAILKITGNDERSSNGGGIFNGSDGKMTLPAGAVIKNNHAAQTGGGICNAGTISMPMDVKLFNNHADQAGDDVYNRANATMNLPSIGKQWRLDGNPDCEDKIDGWYADAENARWEAHAENADQNHAELFEETTVATLTALKAAHGIPQEKISYPGLEKSIVLTDEGGTQTEVKDDDVAAGDSVDFKLESNVPENLKDYIAYSADAPEIVPNALGQANEYILIFHDEMNEAFVNPRGFEVKIGDIELNDSQYTLTQNPEDACDFEISLNLAALYNAGVITEADLGVTPITVTYTATLKEGTTAGTYENTAWVSYPSNESEKDTVNVDTYQIKIFKYDQADNAGLEGARFELYQKDTEGAVIDDSVMELTSGEDGYIVVDGLDAGTYYLKETEAPNGYVCSEDELSIILPGNADGKTNIANVKFANSEIPNTGGTGTRMYMIVGGVIVIAAGLLLIISRKSRKNQES